MISNDAIQSSWISSIKSKAAVTSLVSAAEVREDSWKGTNFVYPNIRVKLTRLAPQIPSKDCQLFISDVDILVFGEQKSSRTIDQIAGAVVQEYWGRSFTMAGVKFTKVSWTETIPASVPEYDEDSWVSIVRFSCLVQSA